jgi:pentatricopeptide repeat protein
MLGLMALSLRNSCTQKNKRNLMKDMVEKMRSDGWEPNEKYTMSELLKIMKI